MGSRSGILVLLIALSSGFGVARAQSAPPATPGELRRNIEEMLDQPDFAGARWGVLIQTLDGRTVFGRDEGRAFIPASNVKLYTTATALDQFGPDARVRTSIYGRHQPGRDGVLRGDLIFFGRGAPNLSPRFADPSPRRYSEMVPARTIPAIEELADQIKARGIRLITGGLIGDDSFFPGDRLGPGWEWDDAQYYYGAEVSALTVNDNSLTLVIRPGRRAGEAPAVELLPETRYVRVINRAVTTRNGEPRIRVERALNSNTIEIVGSIPLRAASRQIDVAIHNPALFAATLLREALTRRRIRVAGLTKHLDATARISQPFDETLMIELAGLESEPLSEMIKVVNKESQNLHAELLLRQLGRAAISAAATSDPTGATSRNPIDDYGVPVAVITAGNNLRRQFLEKAGVDTRPLSLRDGSGLARQNLVTPAATVRLLTFMATHPFHQQFTDSLVVAGIDGTMERRLQQTAVAGNLRGKTGTLSYVNALSGYLQTRSGTRLVISLMGNNFVGSARAVTSTMDRICILLAEYEGRLE